MKLWKAASFILLAFGVLAAIYAASLMRRGFSARETPSSIEVFAANLARKWAVPSGYREIRNPLAASPDNIRAGMEHFADHCATCHANDRQRQHAIRQWPVPETAGTLRTAETQRQERRRDLLHD